MFNLLMGLRPYKACIRPIKALLTHFEGVTRHIFPHFVLSDPFMFPIETVETTRLICSPESAYSRFAAPSHLSSILSQAPAADPRRARVREEGDGVHLPVQGGVVGRDVRVEDGGQVHGLSGIRLHLGPQGRTREV